MTFALTIRSSLVSNMAWFTCRICLGTVIVVCFPIAVNSLTTETVHRRQAMPHYFNKHQPICAKIRALSKQVRHKRLLDPEAEQLTYQEREPHPGWMAYSREITTSPSLVHWLFFIRDCRWVFLFPLRQNGPLASSGKQEARHHDGGKQLLHG